ncbi:MAG: hypothetical protein JOZ02_16905 [Acidobacteria bacterium]|nr:hypothetical protein [Acidobacteriota bacterium]
MTKSFNLRSGALAALMLAAGILVMGSTAQAQYRRDHDNDRYRRERNRDWRRERNTNVYDRNGNGVDDRYERNGSYGTYGTYGNNGRYGSYGGYGGGYNQAAVNQGYQYGLNTGASDAQRGQSYSPQRSHYYKNASSQAFRQGFTQGYDQGYRQYGGYNNGRYRTGSGIGNILGGIFGRR